MPLGRYLKAHKDSPALNLSLFYTIVQNNNHAKLDLRDKKISSMSKRKQLIDTTSLSLVKRGGHIGHTVPSILQPRSKYPLSSQLLLGRREKLDLVCPFSSGHQASYALHLTARVLRRGGHVLLIDTRGEASCLQRFVETQARSLPSSISFVGQHWVGGTLTNWSNISKVVRRCAEISNQFDSFLVSNRLHLPRYEKMMRSYPGLLQPLLTTSQSTPKRVSSCKSRVKLTGCPDLLLVINPAENRGIVRESERLGIPIVGVVASNDSLDGITVPVPVNPTSLLWPDSFGVYAIQLAASLEGKEMQFKTR